MDLSELPSMEGFEKGIGRRLSRASTYGPRGTPQMVRTDSKAVTP